jgi:hypothetical protein
VNIVDADFSLKPKFADVRRTAKGGPRAHIDLRALEVLWFNTGTLCNITCANCYIESSPRNDRFAYLSLDDVKPYLDEIRRERLPTTLIGFTGGEPFMNSAFPAILEATLAHGFQTLTLTNAMRPMTRRKNIVARLASEYGPAMRFRVSLDDYRAEVHDRERGKGSFANALHGLTWLASSGVTVEICARHLSGDDDASIRAGFARLLANNGVNIDCDDPQQLMILPEIEPGADPPEITPACWSILNVSPHGIMCANARMVVRRKESARPAVLACTLLPYDDRFELGPTLKEAAKPVYLAHKYCATFCVLGGASCGASR